MEIRTLRYFLEVAREESITRAAQTLHISQPTLSKQLKELESELGKTLFVRSNYGIKLTDEGHLLRNRAEDILSMVDKTTEEFMSLDNIQGGTLQFGCAESYLIHHLAHTLNGFRQHYPRLQVNILSGNTKQVIDMLDNSLIDMAVIVEPPNLDRYNYLEFPGYDTWGLLMRDDHPLAQKTGICADDLVGEDIICSDQSMKVDIPRWCGEKKDLFNHIGSTNLFYNGAILVQEGFGVMLTFDHLANTAELQSLVFRPLEPALKNKMYIIWKKYQVFTPIAERFIQVLQEDDTYIRS